MGKTVAEKEVTTETAAKLGLLAEEFDKIKSILGRTPNFTELSIFSVMWSEHCSYKNSIKWLKTLPRDGKKMLVKAGDENAGLMDIGDGYGVVFKIESQPSIRHRTFPGCCNRSWWNKQGYFYHGCPSDRFTQFTALWKYQ